MNLWYRIGAAAAFWCGVHKYKSENAAISLPMRRMRKLVAIFTGARAHARWIPAVDGARIFFLFISFSRYTFPYIHAWIWWCIWRISASVFFFDLFVLEVFYANACETLHTVPWGIYMYVCSVDTEMTINSNVVRASLYFGLRRRRQRRLHEGRLKI